MQADSIVRVALRGLNTGESPVLLSGSEEILNRSQAL
jgi:hypothetical protein